MANNQQRFLRFAILVILGLGFVREAQGDMASFPVRRMRALKKVPRAPVVPAERVCQHYAAQMERSYGIPDKLLTAVSLTESGRPTMGGLVSWPWSINAEGKSYFFSTKSEAVRAVRRFQAKGVKSIDVGCMQINLHHHPDAFTTLEEAFDPAKNVAYGAFFLSSLQKSHKNWVKAVAHYHSGTPSLHRPYQDKVLKTWLEEKQKKPTLFSQRLYPFPSTRASLHFDRRPSLKGHHSLQQPPAWVRKTPAFSAGASDIAEVQRIPPPQVRFKTHGKRLTKVRASSGNTYVSKRPPRFFNQSSTGALLRK